MRRLNKPTAMDRLRNMLIEILPGYTLKVVETNKTNAELMIEMHRYSEECESNPRIVYLVHLLQTCPYMNLITSSLNCRHHIMIGNRGYTFDPNVPFEQFRRHIEMMQEHASAGIASCDVCTVTCNTLFLCQCKYAVCAACMRAIYCNGLGANLNQYRCPNCRQERDVVRRQIG